MSLEVFICTGLAHRSYIDDFSQNWCDTVHEIDVTKLKKYVGHNIETLMYMEALQRCDPNNYCLILTDRFKLTDYGEVKLESKVEKMMSDDIIDIYYLSHAQNRKTHEVMLISPRGRSKILGDLGLPDGRILKIEKNLQRQLDREAELDNFSVHFCLNDFFWLDPANIKINHQYENGCRKDPVVILPQIVPPPQFRISGLVWFIFIVFLVLIVAWAVIKIGPGGHKTTKSDEELSARIPLRGETEFFEPLPYLDQFSPDVIR